MVENLKDGQTGRMGRLYSFNVIVYSYYHLSGTVDLSGTVVEHSTSMRDSACSSHARYLLTCFIDIRITYSASRTRSRRHKEKVEVIALCYIVSLALL